MAERLDFFFPSESEFWRQQHYTEILTLPFISFVTRTSHYNYLSFSSLICEEDHIAHLHRTAGGTAEMTRVVFSTGPGTQ